jgi:hypothetical protein
MGSELFSAYGYHFRSVADNNSQYQTNIVLQLSDNETVKNATNALTKKHPDNSYIAKIDDSLPLYLTKVPSLL